MSSIVYFLLIICIVGIDQLSKLLAVKYLLPISSIPIVKDVLHLTYVENRGAAFGMLSNHRWIFMIVSTVMMVVLGYLMFRYREKLHPIMMTGLVFVVGGGIGNMIDRTLSGFVVDFIDFTLIDFAVFNLADSFICVGVGLIVLDIIIGKSDLSFLDGKKSNKDNEDDN